MAKVLYHIIEKRGGYRSSFTAFSLPTPPEGAAETLGYDYVGLFPILGHVSISSRELADRGVEQDIISATLQFLRLQLKESREKAGKPCFTKDSFSIFRLYVYTNFLWFERMRFEIHKDFNRHYSDSRMSERALREIYLRGFEICVKEAQPWTIMTSYNLINARRVCECHELIDGILRQEWGFQGMVTSDWYVRCDQTNCVLAGNDIRMPNGFPEVLTQALNEGRLQRGHLEACVKRILEMILKLD